MDREQRERLVDGALARALTPETIEPREGLEERLLANLAAQPERRPWGRWIWVPALAAVAVLAIVLGINFTRRPAPVIETHRTTAPPPQPAESARANVSAPQPVRHRRARRVPPRVQLARATPAKLPKLDVFPTPVPTTEQERMLLALVRRRPQQAQEIAAEQEADRQQIQKYLESGPPADQLGTAPQMR